MNLSPRFSGILLMSGIGLSMQFWAGSLELPVLGPIRQVAMAEAREGLPTAEAPDRLPTFPGEAPEALAVAAPDQSLNLLGERFAALDTSALDEMRGGFELAGSGLRFSFGIERAVFINGELVAATVLNLKDIQSVVGTGGMPLTPGEVSASALGVIQNGAGNNIAGDIPAGLSGTIIQNSLNDQQIQSVTTINANVNSLQVLRAMSVQSAIQNGIVGSLRR